MLCTRQVKYHHDLTRDGHNMVYMFESDITKTHFSSRLVKDGSDTRIFLGRDFLQKATFLSNSNTCFQKNAKVRRLHAWKKRLVSKNTMTDTLRPDKHEYH
jgi:hypothetical protein